MACVALLSLPLPLGASDPILKVIAHPNRAGELTRDDIRAIYLKQKLFWDDGEAIVPINREAGSSVRESFSERIFGRTSRQLASYWNQRYFQAGEFPPPTLASDEAVLQFVGANVNAIGYIETRDVGNSVSVVLLVE